MKVMNIGAFLIIFSGAMHGFGQKTLVSIRSQAVNGVRQLAGWQRLIYRPDLDATNVTMGVTPEYNHSFDSNDIASVLFGCPELVFSGSQVIGRDETDILADYFGLPSDFKSVVQFKPTIVNFVMDLDFHIGLDGLTPGLYCNVHLPIVHAKWDLNMVECVADAGSTFTSYPAGYLAATPIPLSSLTSGNMAPKNVMTVFQGNATFGDMREPLRFGKIFGRQTETRVAELRCDVGYNFLLRDWYHLGVALQVAAPTGTLRKSEFLFEPIAGNDHHWELGGAVTGHVDFWQDEHADQKLSLFCDAHITHMFRSRQKRSFDLKNNGNGSRYILLQEIAAPSVGLHVGLAPNDVPAVNQYQGRLVPAINRTTLDVDVSVGVQADLVLKLSYKRRGFEFDLGYNLWARSKEKCEGRDSIANCYAVKGDAQVYGFTNPGQTPVALAATQSNATINHGQAVTSSIFSGLDPNNFNDGLEFANINANNIDNASDTLGVALNQLTTADANRLNIGLLPVRTSNPPVLVTNSDIDECSALLPRAISHKLFFYLGYQLERPDLHLIPYIGVGGFAEFADLSPCNNSAIPQWGVWLKMGLAYGV